MGSGLGPGERLAAEEFLTTLWFSMHLVWLSGVSSDLLKNILGWEVKDLDAALSGNDEPVKFLREEDAVNGGTSIVRSEVFSVDDVPDHDHTVVGA